MTMSEAIQALRKFEAAAHRNMDTYNEFRSRHADESIYDDYHRAAEELLKALTGQEPSDGDVEQVTAK